MAGLARDFGVRVDAPVVLNDGANLLLHLAPAPVVARVATATAVIRPGVAAWLARDVALAGFLDARGVPVTRPAEELSAGPGPHERDGLAV